MAIKDLIKKPKREGGEEFIEIEPQQEEGKVNVRVETLRDYIDTDRIQQLVREGNVVFLKIKELRVRDMSELKRAVDKLRKTCIAMNGDIIGVDEDFLVVAPNFARIYRGRTA